MPISVLHEEPFCHDMTTSACGIAQIASDSVLTHIGDRRVMLIAFQSEERLMDDEAKEFWGAFETETGEKVEARSEGNWIHGIGPTREGRGLLILTDKSFRFKYVPNTIRPFMSSRMTSDNADRAEFTVERRDIVSLYACRSAASSRGCSGALSHAARLSHAAQVERRHTCSRPTPPAASSLRWKRPGPLRGQSFTKTRMLRTTSFGILWPCGFWDLSARTPWAVTSMSHSSSGSSCSSFHW